MKTRKQKRKNNFQNKKLPKLSGVFVYWELFLKKSNPAIIIVAPTICTIVNISPSKTPQIIATIGINKVTVDANNGVDIFSKR